MKFLSRWFGRSQAPRSTFRFDAPIRPDETFYAIGDVHGSYRQLRKLVDQIDREAPDARIICLGDYVDRGENSAEVLSYLIEEQQNRGDRLVCLKGNHEVMCLDFLTSPDEQGAFWLRNGGLQTLASYRLRVERGAFHQTARDLRDAMGEELIAWIRNLPLTWRSGNVVALHAGADPNAPIDDQQERHLLWGHRDFSTTPRHDGVWIVHGHTIVDRAAAQNGRISTDTGAYGTGILTAARISPDGVQFLQVP